MQREYRAASSAVPGALLLALAIALVTSVGGVPAAAEPTPSWTGFHFGGHVGALAGETTVADPDGPQVFGGNILVPGFLAGLQVGYDRQLTPRWVAGLGIDASVVAASGRNTCLQSSIGLIGSSCKETPRLLATMTGRLGFLTEPHGRTMIYGDGGLAWMQTTVSANPNAVPQGYNFSGDPAEQGEPTSITAGTWGWTVGAGVEYALSPRWTMDWAYNYMRFSGLRMPTPETIDVSTSGAVNAVPPTSAGLMENMHVFKMGLNYRWGGPAAATPDGSANWTEASAAEQLPGWEFEGGLRYWYSSGRYVNANGSASVLVSRLSYDNLNAHTGEVFGRVDSPIGVFVKGFVGAGTIVSGKHFDEDWGLPADFTNNTPIAYEATQSEAFGTLNYLTADVGYSFMRGPGHKLGMFLGYNRYRTVVNGMGCTQLANYSAGICVDPTAANIPTITQTDTWQSVRVGASAIVDIGGGFGIGADVAYLPVVMYDGLDEHLMRTPIVLFPLQGAGQGVQAEMILSYRATDAISVGLGGRYWAMWSGNAYQVNVPTNAFTVSTERYGVFLQLAYRFSPG